MKEDDKIEDLFKKEFENFEPEVNPSVWRNIQIGLKGFGIGALIKLILNKIGTSTIVAVASSVVAIISTVLVMHWTGSGDKNIHAATTKKAVAPVTTVTKPVEVVNESNSVNNNKEEQKQTDTKETVSSEPNKTLKTDKKEMESVINKFSQKPIADIFASPISGEVPLIVNLVNNGTGKVNKWTFGDSKSVETETNPVHIYNEPGIYKVKLTSTNSEGKTTVDSTTIEVAGNPSMSTIPTDFPRKSLPMKLSNTQNIITMHAIIFDKEGKIVYESDEIDPKWDGKNLKGQSVKEGIYFYIINAVGAGGKKYERQGSVNLTK